MRSIDTTILKMLSRLNNKYGLDVTLVGNEGGFASNILDSKECLIETAIKNARYMGKIKIGMEVTASMFYV
jgi:enolase